MRLCSSAHEGMQLPASKAVADAAAVYVCPSGLRLRLPVLTSLRPTCPSYLGMRGVGIQTSVLEPTHAILSRLSTD